MSEHEHFDDVITRLSKIEGHIRGIKKMLEEEKPCEQILMQMSAVKSALNKATKILLEDHYDHCIVAQNKDDALNTELIEFKKILESFMG